MPHKLAVFFMLLAVLFGAQLYFVLVNSVVSKGLLFVIGLVLLVFFWCCHSVNANRNLPWRQH